MPLENQENNQSAISDMLIQTNTLISSALSGREVVTAILQRMTELNQYLDPNFYENYLDNASKRQFILTLYPEIKKYGESIQRLKSLIPVLDSEHLNNVPSLCPKLEQLTLTNLQMYEESQQVSQSIAKALQQYNEIIYSITRTFIQLEEIVTHLESEMKRNMNNDI